MSIDKKTLVNAINLAVRKAGFKKRGSSWYFETEDTVLVLDLQSSKWGRQYYINLGILLKKLEYIPFPKEYQCHMRVRLSSLVPHKKETITKLLDMENSTQADNEKLEGIDKVIKSYALPFLLSLSSEKKIKKFLKENKIKDMMISLKAKEFLA